MPTLEQIEQQGLWRQRLIADALTNQTTNFANNDYLNLTQENRIKQTLATAISQYGTGSGSSSVVCGYSQAQQRLEKRFADFLGRERALFFNSGYMANLGAITCLANRHSRIIADKLCHASIIDAMQLSRAQYWRHLHQDNSQLKAMIASKKPDLLITESVFSMEGDITSLNDMSQLGAETNSQWLVDDAHAIGVLGQHGAGICQHFKLSQQDIPYLITPLGKAFGHCGAIVSGSDNFIESLIQKARTYRYTTALPAAICHSLIKTLDIVKTDNWRREKLQTLIHFFNDLAKQYGLSLSSYDPTPIRCIIIGDNHKVMQIQQQLLKLGFFVAAIRPPTVPKNTARIRISLNCGHSQQQISDLLSHLARLCLA